MSRTYMHQVSRKDILPSRLVACAVPPTLCVLRYPADSASDPLFYAAYVVEPGRRRDGLYYPTLTWRTLPLKLSVAEATLWRCMSCALSLSRLATRSSEGDEDTAISQTLSTSRASASKQTTAGQMTTTHQQVSRGGIVKVIPPPPLHEARSCSLWPVMF